VLTSTTISYSFPHSLPDLPALFHLVCILPQMASYGGGDELNIRTIPTGFSDLYQSYAVAYET